MAIATELRQKTMSVSPNGTFFDQLAVFFEKDLDEMKLAAEKAIDTASSGHDFHDMVLARCRKRDSLIPSRQDLIQWVYEAKKRTLQPQPPLHIESIQEAEEAFRILQIFNDAASQAERKINGRQGVKDKKDSKDSATGERANPPTMHQGQ